ncbi:MAG TPA: 16S rRNA (guanine(966)-N(2))-methyltransferase RsmD [Vicinamibacterales bacterium]
MRRGGARGHASRASRSPATRTGLRIIAGRLKGRRLLTPDWADVRPTSDRLRETLFNVLRDAIPGARVLDAFAGTGALGLEAVSRGAAHVTFADVDRRALDLIATNIERTGVAEGYTIVRADLARGGAVFAPQFDVVLADPPYDMDPAPILAGLSDAVAGRGLVVLEHARRTGAPERAGALRRTRLLEAGDSALSFYRREADATGAAGPEAEDGGDA